MTAKTLETRICLGSTTSLFARGTLSRLAVPQGPAQMSRCLGRVHWKLARAYDRKRQVHGCRQSWSSTAGRIGNPESHAESCNPGCKLVQPMQQRRLGSADVFGSCDPRMHVSLPRHPQPPLTSTSSTPCVLTHYSFSFSSRKVGSSFRFSSQSAGSRTG